jgi:1-acyl-sn-glycerol-3-phosphate acyltransferase
MDKQGDDPLIPPFFFAVGRWFCRVVLEDFFDLEFFGEEHVPQNGPCILAANHCSFLDPPAAVIGGMRNTYSFARKTLFKKGIMGKIFSQFLTIPVDRDGGNDIAAIRAVLRCLKERQSVLIFPEGSRSPDGSLQPFRHGMAMLAAKAQVPIVPVCIFGSYDAWNRHGTGIKAYTPVRVIYGSPLNPEDYDPGSDHNDRYAIISQRIFSAMTALSCKKP